MIKKSHRSSVLRRVGIHLVSVVLFAVFACTPFGGSGQTPCLNPIEWTSETGNVMIRAALEGPDSILIAIESQLIEKDGSVTDVRSEVVYQFDPSLGSFSAVDRMIWDQATSEIVNCTEYDSIARESRIALPEQHIPSAYHNVKQLLKAPSSEVVAILATNGINSGFILGSGGASGQHVHYLVSDLDGSLLNNGTRVAIGGLDQGRSEGCWTPDEKYVVYLQHKPQSQSYNLVCPVAVDLSRVPSMNELESDVWCFNPDAWAGEFSGTLLVREELGDTGRLLLTIPDDSGRQDVSGEGDWDGVAHREVYAYSVAENTTILVESTIWDSATPTSKIEDCGRPENQRCTRFDLNCSGRDPVTYRDTIEVETRGDTPLRIIPSNDLPFAGVLSTDGLGRPCGTNSTGQHFFQLFSELDGSMLGQPLRVGVGGPDVGVVSCVSPNDSFAVLWQFPRESLSRQMICLIPLNELPDPIRNGELPFANGPRYPSPDGAWTYISISPSGPFEGQQIAFTLDVQQESIVDVHHYQMGDCYYVVAQGDGVSYDEQSVTFQFTVDCVGRYGEELVYAGNPDIVVSVTATRKPGSRYPEFLATVEENYLATGETVTSSDDLLLVASYAVDECPDP